MKFKNIITSVFLSIALLLPLISVAAPTISEQYQLEDRKRISRTEYEYTYKVTLTNTESTAIKNVKATATSTSSQTVLVDNTVSFNDLNAGESGKSTDVLVIRQNRRSAFDPSSLAWNVSFENDDNEVIPQFIVNINNEHTSGVIGTTFNLSGEVIKSESSSVKWNWEISDGRKLTGKNINISFLESGIYQIKLKAENSNGKIYEIANSIVIFDQNKNAPDKLNLPEKMGDVDKNGLIELKDVHLISKHATRIETLQDSDQRIADINFDGDVTVEDSRLVAEAVMDGAELPNKILSDRGYPGAVVSLISPHLLDAEATFKIQVGKSVLTQNVSRIALGYANFFVPFDATNTNSVKVTAGEIDVSLLKNDVVVETYSFYVEEPNALPADPKAELLTFFSDVKELFKINESNLIDQLDQAGIIGNERDILLATAKAGMADALEAINSQERLLARGDADGFAELIYRILQANGFDDLQSDLKKASLNQNSVLALRTSSPDEVCDLILPSICAIQATAKVLNNVSKVASIACDLLLLATGVAAIVPADGPVVDAALMTAWLAKCTAVEFGVKIASIVTTIIGQIDADLKIESSSIPTSSNSHTISVLLEVFGADDICEISSVAGTNAATKVLITKLAERVVNELLRQDFMARNINNIFIYLGGDFLNKFLNKLTSVTTGILTPNKTLESALANLSDSLCSRFGGADLILPSKRTLKGFTPNVGTLTHETNGEATYECPTTNTNFSGKVTFTASKDICGKTQTKTVDVSCQLKPVTITMGDNGAINDDIFEVVIDGDVILTSSVAVRSTSTTVFLPVGNTQVKMNGHAAPDGVGTYFISFSGASVISGDATSGSDLVPGTSKSFTLNVE